MEGGGGKGSCVGRGVEEGVGDTGCPAELDKMRLMVKRKSWEIWLIIWLSYCLLD